MSLDFACFRGLIIEKIEGNGGDVPITNMIWITPPRRRLNLRLRPTLYWRTVRLLARKDDKLALLLLSLT